MDEVGEEGPAETEWVDRAMRLGRGSRERTVGVTEDEKNDYFCISYAHHIILACVLPVIQLGESAVM